MSKEYFIDLVSEFDERYPLSKFMEYVEDNYDPLTSHMLNNISELKPAGQVPISGNDFRPDVLAYQIFGDTQYWWILMVFNSYLTVDDIKTGNNTAFPDIGDLEDLYFTLSVKQDVA